MVKVLSFLTNAFPLWILVTSLLVLINPAWFTWFSGPLITVGLGFIMLGMLFIPLSAVFLPLFGAGINRGLPK